jgi:hypothetical protein
VKIFTLADVPDELAQAWLQHLRDFDTAHDGCHFKVVNQPTRDMSLGEMIRAIEVDPSLELRYAGPRDGVDDALDAIADTAADALRAGCKTSSTTRSRKV